MAGYPLLTKVLADAMAKRAATVTTRDTSVWGRQEGQFTIAAIPPDIADRLERALGECQHVYVLDAGEVPCEREELVHGVGLLNDHEYVPLVTP